MTPFDHLSEDSHINCPLRARPITASRLSRLKVVALAEMYTEDAILVPGGIAPAVPGPVAITKFWEGSITAGFKDHTLAIVETHADGNLAYVLSTWTVKKVGGGPNNNEESTLQGHTLRVLLKQSDGTWKTKVHIFVPLASPVPQDAKK